MNRSPSGSRVAGGERARRAAKRQRPAAETGGGERCRRDQGALLEPEEPAGHGLAEIEDRIHLRSLDPDLERSDIERVGQCRASRREQDCEE